MLCSYEIADIMRTFLHAASLAVTLRPVRPGPITPGLT